MIKLVYNSVQSCISKLQFGVCVSKLLVHEGLLWLTICKYLER